MLKLACPAALLYEEVGYKFFIDHSNLGVRRASYYHSRTNPRPNKTFLRVIGLAYPLFNGFLPLYLQTRLQTSSNSINNTYRDYSIISVLGIPGSIIACILIDFTRNAGKVAIGGRKLALALFTLLTGIFLFLFTISKNEAAYLGFSCASSLTQWVVPYFCQVWLITSHLHRNAVSKKHLVVTRN